MAYENPNVGAPFYPQVIDSNPESSSALHSNPTQSSSSLYPTIDPNDIVDNPFAANYHTTHNPDIHSHSNPNSPSSPPDSVEEMLLTVPGAILHLIDKQYSVELACGDLSIIRLRQGDTVVAVFARVAQEIQWPLAKDVAAVKLDESHYFFSFRAPKEAGSDSSDEDGGKEESSNDSHSLLNYGLTIASKGQEGLLKQLDKVFGDYINFSAQKVEPKGEGKELEVLDASVAKEMSPADLKSEKKKELMEEKCAAYWTTLAPNVEDYSGTAAKMIAAGSGQLIRGILWCGDVTVDRLKWGNQFLKKKMAPGAKSEISPETLKRIKRVKRVTRMTEKVASGVLSGVVKVSGVVTSSVVNSKVGKKFFSLLPGEMVLASLDGFSKVCDAVEVAGRNVMSTSSTVTTGLVSHRHGEEAAKATSEGLDAAGHAIGTAWAVLKIRKALNPKSALKPSTLAKSAVKSAAKSAVGDKKAKSSK